MAVGVNHMGGALSSNKPITSRTARDQTGTPQFNLLRSRSSLTNKYLLKRSPSLSENHFRTSKSPSHRDGMPEFDFEFAKPKSKNDAVTSDSNVSTFAQPQNGSNNSMNTHEQKSLKSDKAELRAELEKLERMKLSQTLRNVYKNPKEVAAKRARQALLNASDWSALETQSNSSPAPQPPVKIESPKFKPKLSTRSRDHRHHTKSASSFGILPITTRRPLKDRDQQTRAYQREPTATRYKLTVYEPANSINPIKQEEEFALIEFDSSQGLHDESESIKVESRSPESEADSDVLLQFSDEDENFEPKLEHESLRPIQEIDSRSPSADAAKGVVEPFEMSREYRERLSIEFAAHAHQYAQKFVADISCAQGIVFGFPLDLFQPDPPTTQNLLQFVWSETVTEEFSRDPNEVVASDRMGLGSESVRRDQVGQFELSMKGSAKQLAEIQQREEEQEEEAMMECLTHQQPTMTPFAAPALYAIPANSDPFDDFVAPNSVSAQVGDFSATY